VRLAFFPASDQKLDGGKAWECMGLE